MKYRILNNWSLIRVLFVGIGVAVIIQSAMIQQWFGIAFGLYFASMGLFNYGCVSGICYGKRCANTTKNKSEMINEEIDIKEFKTK